MSGEGVPYRLRPHKAVERRLFLEMLTRWERWRALDRHVYVSMAGYTMEDQKLVHRLVGIERLLAFDQNPEVVERQKFNRPTCEAKCVTATANEITSDIEKSVRDAGIDDAAGYVVWLDYTDPGKIRRQLDEFRTLVAQLTPGDVVKITVNAAPGSWGKQRKSEDKEEGPLLQEKLRGYVFDMLKRRLGDLLSPMVKAEDLNDEGLARALAQAIELAAARATKSTPADVLEPLSIVRYADGLQMLSVTAGMAKRSDVQEIRERLQISSWPFGAAKWSDVRFIAVPDLTTRERLYLERNTNLEAASIASEVGFDFDVVTNMPGFVENFRNYYRHYPALSPVEI